MSIHHPETGEELAPRTPRRCWNTEVLYLCIALASSDMISCIRKTSLKEVDPPAEFQGVERTSTKIWQKKAAQFWQNLAKNYHHSGRNNDALLYFKFARQQKGWNGIMLQQFDENSTFTQWEFLMEWHFRLSKTANFSTFWPKPRRLSKSFDKNSGLRTVAPCKLAKKDDCGQVNVTRKAWVVSFACFFKAKTGRRNFTCNANS